MAKPPLSKAKEEKVPEPVQPRIRKKTLRRYIQIYKKYRQRQEEIWNGRL